MRAAVIHYESPWQERAALGIAAAIAVLLLAWLDRHVHHNVPLGLIYLFPMALISTVTRRWEVFIAAALLTLVAEYSDAFPWTPTQGMARDALYFIAGEGKREKHNRARADDVIEPLVVLVDLFTSQSCTVYSWLQSFTFVAAQ